MSKHDAQPPGPSFLARVRVALVCFWRALTRPDFCRELAAGLPSAAASRATEPAAARAPERVHASALAMLAMLQREGRLLDFLQEDVASFPDADVGAAARVVHGGCRKALAECLALEPVLREAEGASVTVPAGFDAQRIRLTGNVAGSPPFRGTLKHHGWVTAAARFPVLAEALDPRVLAPAEVEL
ncbi:MAG: DUF2760 domain-containing protein [Verrucomicrobia bacterium]|nr:DUF2760 domain-containing protein [Verrucomicrobiota bacterium]